MPRAIPPLELVARALAALGQSRAAIELLELGVQRGGEEGLRAEPLLATLRARSDVLLGAPGVRLDVDLVEAIATNGRLREALVVARAIDSGGTVLGLEISHALEVVLAPIAPDEPADMAACFREGIGGSAIAAQRVVLSPNASPDLRHRAQLLVQLLRGFRAMTSSPGPTEGLSVDPPVAAVIAEMLQRRDLLWGRRALEKVLALPGGRVLHEAVHDLIVATDHVAHEDGPGGVATSPVQGDGVALLHIRMVNLDQAERTLRRICVERPDDRSAPRLLAAVSRLRAVQDASADEARPSEASPKGAPPEWLNKRARRGSVEGWAASAKRGVTPVTYEEAATSVLRPDDEAELHLRAGRPDKAVELYRRLAERFPDRTRFAERADEIARQMEQRALMFADEMTVRRDLRGLAAHSASPPTTPAPIAAPAPASALVAAPVAAAVAAAVAGARQPQAIDFATTLPATPAISAPSGPVAVAAAFAAIAAQTQPAPSTSPQGVRRSDRTVEMEMHFSQEQPVEEESTASSALPSFTHDADGATTATMAVAVRPIIGIS